MWLARKKFERMLKHYYYLVQITHHEEKNLKNVIFAERQRTILNLKYPTKAKDFEALYSTIPSDHSKNITTARVKIENIELLKKELNCLKSITKHRNQAIETAEEKKFFYQLDEMSKPVVVTRTNGRKIFIETPDIFEVRKLKELYVALKRHDTSTKERTELLLILRVMLENFKEVDMTKRMINLLTRELNMLNVLQFEGDKLQMLRRRIEIEFKWLLKQPEINPAIAKLPKSINYMKCINCRKSKSLNSFVVKFNLSKTVTCKDCRHLRRIAVERINLAPHEVMLKYIKATEERLNAKSSLAFILQVEDLYYLVKIIWQEKSAISESKDILQLRLVRWHNEREWSPSNTILLTIEEAYVHTKIRDVSRVYSSKFIEGVQFNHQLATKYFKGLIEKTVDCDRKIWTTVNTLDTY